MGLDKNNKNYFYNLGRVVAIVEIMEDTHPSWVRRVFSNASENLPYNLRQALAHDKHNIHGELIDPADIVLNRGELPKTPISACDENGQFWIGHYHERHYLDGKYNGCYGNVETVVEHYTPERIETFEEPKTIDELRR